jgi:glyoxylase-like metal-dependent hydrolase (beta-lactamase superfamily II)
LTAWDRDVLLQKLDEYSVKPDQVDYVVCSHGHSDHIGNLNLFLNAKHFVGSCLNFKDDYFFDHDFEKDPFILDDGIEIISTPGHTSSCVSMIVKNSNFDDGKCIAIVGDLFEKEEDIEHELIWIGAGSDDPQKQKQNRLKIAKLADFIIPGHGKIFTVTDQMIERLQNQLQ